MSNRKLTLIIYLLSRIGYVFTISAAVLDDIYFRTTMNLHFFLLRIKNRPNCRLGRRYSGTYLPGVALEQGWTKEETLESLSRKAGYRGQMTKDLIESIQVTRYQSQKITLDYDDYVNGRF